jgi:lysozyme
MKTSPGGLKLIEDFEGLRLVAYQDLGGVWTIGYGHTRDVCVGQTCTQAEAEAFLVADVAAAETAVSSYVHVPLNQNQFDALVSFTFNVGAGAFAASTLRKCINAGAFNLASDEFLKWDRIGPVDNLAMRNRRDAERYLFNTPEIVT